MSRVFREVMDDKDVRKYLPDISFAHGIHLLAYRDVNGLFRGTGWVDGVMVRAHNTDINELRNSFIKKYGLPRTLRVFQTIEQAKVAYPNFYL